MFPGFANVWTPVALSREVRDQPVSFELAHERIVVFRTPQGGLGALIDRCPHRGVALSLGCVTAEGQLQCGFHGWEFGPDGTCHHVPLNALTADKRERLKATAIPVREIGGLIWVFTGTGPAVPSEPVVPTALVEPGWATWLHAETWQCHWTRAMENMLDTPHVPFLHRRTIGRGMRKRLRRDSVMEMQVDPTETGMRISNHLDGQRSPGMLEWNRPNAMTLFITPPERKPGLRQHIWCVPLDETRTRMILVSTRGFGRYIPLMTLFDNVNRLILLEDKRIVESSQPGVVPEPTAEMSVATDGPTLAFRRYFRQELAAPVAPRP